MAPKIAPYGTWETVITEDYVISKIANTIDEVLLDPRTLAVYRLESRPKEAGRGVLVRVVHTPGQPDQYYDVTDPTKWNVRTGVHAYGGAAATVFDGTAYFSNFSFGDKVDGRVYKVQDKGPSPTDPTAITPENINHRFAGLAVCPKDPKFIVAILEDHTKDPKGDQPQNVGNMLCVIDAESETPNMNVIHLAGEHPTQDFFGPPAFSPDGTHIAWQQWHHPYMPWDQAEIYVADVTTDPTFMIENVRAVTRTKDPRQVSLAYPNWSDDNTLIFTSDVSGFINPWKYDISKENEASPVFSPPVPLDFGCPMWSLHFFPFTVLDKQRALFIVSEHGHDSLYSVNLENPDLPPKPLDTGCVVIDGLRTLGKGKDGNFQVVFAGTKVDEETQLVYLTVQDSGDGSLRASVANFGSAETQPLSKDWISTPTTYDDIPGYYGNVHAVYYAPKNPNYSGSPGEKPPCIVHVHGGPEWLQPQGLDWTKQYLTSRGWAWLDVNYGGSSGFGREYRERLLKLWGVVDTDDCMVAVQELSNPWKRDRYLIDPRRVCIRGGSAGGFTTYTALSCGRYTGVFAAGASIYGGVADLKSLVTKAEKFELHYTEKFMGGTIQEVPLIYEQRSPLTHAGDIKLPLMILHGENDPVVPVEQARDMYKYAGVYADIQVYKREGHHFGEDEHIKDALRRERDCYERALRLKGLTAAI